MDVVRAFSAAERATPNDQYDLAVPACATCRFWNPEGHGLKKGIEDNGFGMGFCRRRPPAIVDVLARVNMRPPRPGEHIDGEDVFGPYASYDSAVFPGTFYTQWCGEFEWLPEIQKIEGLNNVR